MKLNGKQWYPDIQKKLLKINENNEIQWAAVGVAWAWRVRGRQACQGGRRMALCQEISQASEVASNEIQ